MLPGTALRASLRYVIGDTGSRPDRTPGLDRARLDTALEVHKVLRAGLAPDEEAAIFRGNIERLLGYAS
jgi:hypothetical protein